MQFRGWALQFVGLTYLLTMPTINSHPVSIWCCSQPSSHPRNSLLNDFANPACCRTGVVRRYTGNVVGIVAAARDWNPAEKMAGFLKKIDESFDNDSFALIVGAWAVAVSGRHWGVGYGSYCFALHAYEPRRSNMKFDKLDCLFGACFAYAARTLCSPLGGNNFLVKALYFALQARIAYVCTECISEKKRK